MPIEKQLFTLLILTCFWLSACTSASDGGAETAVSSEPATIPATHPPAAATSIAWIESNRDPDVPPLPFPDNPDPNQCGIPTAWGDDTIAWLNGIYKDELIQPTVLLYDSHSRLSIAAKAPHGSPVKIILYQQNPVLDYYLVKIEGAPKPNEGWVPGPLLSFEPVIELEEISSS